MNKNRLFSLGIKLNNATYITNNWRLAIKPDSNTIALILLFIALIALACSPIFTKLSEIEISPSATIFHRLWIATIALNLWQVGNNPTEEGLETKLVERSPWSGKQRALLILASIAATTSALCWAWSLTQTSVASSTVLRSFSPLFIALAGWLILNQKCDRQFFLGMILAVVGGITIGWDDLQLGQEYLMGDGIALLSAALHGVNLLVIGYLRDWIDTKTILLWRCGFGALIIFPLVLMTEENLLPVSWHGWLLVFLLAIICQVLGQGLLVYSLKQFSSSFAAIFMLLKPVVTAFLAWIIFAENLSLLNGVALILILSGIYMAKSSSSSEKAI